MPERGYVGSRDAEIRAMLAALEPRLPYRVEYVALPSTGAFRSVADDPQGFDLQMHIPGAETERLNGRMVEHERQSRLRRWQEQRTG